MTASPYEHDVYISYSQQDIEAAGHIAERLKAAGLNVWFFPWFVRPGQDWRRSMQDELQRSASCAILFGATDLGPNQREEVLVDILKRAEASGGDFPVIPVLLPGADEFHLPSFLRERNWVDFRDGLDNERPFNSLLAGIRNATPPSETGVDVENVTRKADPSNRASGTVVQGEAPPPQLRDYLSSVGELFATESGKKLALPERRAFGLAGTMALDAGSPLDSIFYLAALLHNVPSDSRHVGHFFTNALRYQRDRAVQESSGTLNVVELLNLAAFDIFEAPAEVNDNYLEVLPTRELASVIDTAAVIASATEKELRNVKTRHIIGAILAMPGSAALGHLRNLDYDIKELTADFLGYIKEYHPDSVPAWEQFLSPASAPGNGEQVGSQPPPDAPPPDPPAPAEETEQEAEQESIQRASVSDQPSAIDTLGFGPYVKAITTFLVNEKTQPPLTLSIEGEWGSGKSSFMLQLADELRKATHRLSRAALRKRMPELRLERQLRYTPVQDVAWLRRLRVRRVLRAARPIRCLTVEFNPWRHDKENALWASFALEFVRKLSQNMSPPERLRAHVRLLLRRFRWKDGWLILLRMVFLVLIIAALSVAFFQLLWAGGLPPWAEAAGGEDKGAGLFRVLQASGAAGYIAVVLFLLSKFREFVGNPFAFDLRKYVESPDYEGNVAFIEQFHEDFRKIVETYAGDNKVYVFVDDLDRCDVPKAADLMQAINLMISGGESRLVFVIGMDREKVAAGLAVKNEKLLPYLVQRSAGPAAKAGAQGAAPAGTQSAHDVAFGLEYGYNFIEKFIQIPFRVPQPAQMGVRTLLDFIAPLVEDAGEGGAKGRPVPDGVARLVEAGVLVLEESRAEAGGASRGPLGATQGVAAARDTTDARQDEQDAAEILRQAGAHIEVLGVDEDEQSEKEEEREGILLREQGDSLTVRNIVLMVAPALDYNPRRIKQFINLFRLKAYIAYETGLFRRPRAGSPHSELTLEQLGKFVAIGLRWPRLLAELDEEHTLLAELQTLAAGDAKESSSRAVNNWRERDELMRLLGFGCTGLSPDLDPSRVNPDRYSLAALDVRKLLEVSPRVQRGVPAAPPQALKAETPTPVRPAAPALPETTASLTEATTQSETAIN